MCRAFSRMLDVSGVQTGSGQTLNFGCRSLDHRQRIEGRGLLDHDDTGVGAAVGARVEIGGVGLEGGVKVKIGGGGVHARIIANLRLVITRKTRVITKPRLVTPWETRGITKPRLANTWKTRVVAKSQLGDIGKTNVIA